MCTLQSVSRALIYDTRTWPTMSFQRQGIDVEESTVVGAVTGRSDRYLGTAG